MERRRRRRALCRLHLRRSRKQPRSLHRQRSRHRQRLHRQRLHQPRLHRRLHQRSPPPKPAAKPAAKKPAASKRPAPAARKQAPPSKRPALHDSSDEEAAMTPTAPKTSHPPRLMIAQTRSEACSPRRARCVERAAAVARFPPPDAMMRELQTNNRSSGNQKKQ